LVIVVDSISFQLPIAQLPISVRRQRFRVVPLVAGVEGLALRERLGQGAEGLVDDQGLASQVEDGLADLGDRLAGGGGGKVDGQVGQREDLEEGRQALLLDELFAVVVG